MNKDLILREKLALQRTILANQSTLLAFIRTSMYFLVAGLSINNLLEIQYGKYIEIVLVSISILLLIIGFANYKSQRNKIVESEKHIGDYKDEYTHPKN
jgi:putative membrane protein